MKKLSLFLFSVLISGFASAQLTANGSSGSSTTAYTNGTPNDPIYIWCNTTLSAQTGSLSATSANGVAPYTFKWYYHDQTNSSWAPFTTQTGLSSTISSLASDGYRVEVVDATNNVVDCYTAWVWNLNTEVTASASRSNCNQANLSSTVNTTGTFSYYNPPPPESLINPQTSIQVCFSATHTFVSDIAFYLIGPPSCGSPVITLSPNPGAIGQNNVCNSGDNVSNLCFTTSPAGNLDVCTASVPLTGIYSTYGPSATAPNWSSLIGCNAAAGGWRVQIFDCILQDVGALTNATITFSNLTSKCGSPTSVSYTSGAINSVINDFSCTQASASIFEVPVSPTLSTPITINATTTHLWTSSVGITDPGALNTTAPGLPEGTTNFTLTANTSYGSANCTSSASASVSYTKPVVTAGSPQTICEGETVTLAGSGALTYSWNNGVTDNVPFSPASTQTYTVTGTDQAGCQDSATVIITVHPLPDVSGGADRTICLDDEVTLSGTGAVSYTWTNGVTNNVAFAPGSTQTYTVTGTDANGCEYTATVTITVVPRPVAGIATSGALSGTPGLTVSFANTSTNGTSYSWNFGNGQTAVTPDVNQGYTITYNEPGTFTVLLIADNGTCQSSANVIIVVMYPPVTVVDVPNIITPNGDGVNDVFSIYTENTVSLDVTITDRWGTTIAEFDGLVSSWDGKIKGGKDADEGVYFYTYEIVGLDGKESSGHGFLHIVR